MPVQAQAAAVDAQADAGEDVGCQRGEDEDGFEGRGVGLVVGASEEEVGVGAVEVAGDEGEEGGVGEVEAEEEEEGVGGVFLEGLEAAA